jgi:hypothetical protein
MIGNPSLIGYPAHPEDVWCITSADRDGQNGNPGENVGDLRCLILTSARIRPATVSSRQTPHTASTAANTVKKRRMKPKFDAIASIRRAA